jgi:glycosyltransferase involved in cell wall biosynthesis
MAADVARAARYEHIDHLGSLWRLRYDIAVSNAPRVAYVHDQITQNGGAEGTLREMLKLFPSAPLYCSTVDYDVIKWLNDREVHTTLIQHLPYVKAKHYIYSPIMPMLFRRWNLRAYDVLLIDSHSFAHQVQPAPGALTICYYHTPARALWVPEIDNRASSGLFSGLKRAMAKRIKISDLAASKTPDVIFANSKTVAERIKWAYGREVDQIIYPPVNTERWADIVHESEDEGWLFWGRIIEYKRVDIAIRAAKKAGWKLHIVGQGPFEGRLKEIAGGAPNIVFHGHLPFDDLKRLMARCRGVVFPAYEDFGIVPVEALAAGLPVLAFKLGGASESLHAGVGRLFDEQTPESLQAAMDAMENQVFDPAELRQHAKQFDVARFHGEYREAVLSAIERHQTKTKK